MPRFFMIHDLIDKSDPLGRTYKEVNLSKSHNIPLGTLVEIDGGVRLFVVHHHRDCDGTPLYAMSHDPTDTLKHEERFHNPKWVHGWPEDALKVIRLPEGDYYGT